MLFIIQNSSQHILYIVLHSLYMHSTLANSKHSSGEEGGGGGKRIRLRFLTQTDQKVWHILITFIKNFGKKIVGSWNWVAKDTTWIKDATCWSKIRTHHRKCKSGDSPKTIVWSIMAAFWIGIKSHE